MKGVGEMRSNGTFLFSQLFLGCEYARLARTSQQGGEMRSNRTLLFSKFSRGANMLDWPAPPSTVLVRACFWSVRRRGRSFIPEISFREDQNVESHSVRRGIMRYSIFSPWGGKKLDTKLAGVFLVSAKRGAIIYPGDFFQRRRKC